MSRQGQRVFIGTVVVGVILLIAAGVVRFTADDNRILFLLLMAAAVLSPIVGQYLATKRSHARPDDG